MEADLNNPLAHDFKVVDKWSMMRFMKKFGRTLPIRNPLKTFWTLIEIKKSKN
jgi:hypothetical protein